MNSKFAFLLKNHKLEVGLVILASIYYFFFLNRGIVTGDEGYYVHIAERVMKGEMLFRDIAVLHPPAFFYLLAILYKIFGPGLIIGRLVSYFSCLLLLASFLYILSLLKVGNKLKTLCAICIAAFGYPLLNIPLPIWPAILIIIWIVIFYFHFEKSRRVAYLISIGLLLGLLAATKENVGAIFIVITNGVFIYNERKKSLKLLPYLNLGWILIAGFIFLYFFWGRPQYLKEFLDTTHHQVQVFPFMFPSPLKLLHPLGFLMLLPYYFPLLFLLYLGNKLRKLRKIETVDFLSIISVTGFFVLIFPTCDLLHIYPFSGLILSSFLLQTQKTKREIIPYIIVGLLVSTAIYLTFVRGYYRYGQPYKYQNTRLNLPRAAGILTTSDNAAEIMEVNDYLNAHLKKGDPIFVYPLSSMFYFIYERPNPTRYTSLLKGYYTQEQEEKIVKEISGKFKYIIVEGDAKFGTPTSDYVLSQKLVYDKGIKVYKVIH